MEGEDLIALFLALQLPVVVFKCRLFSTARGDVSALSNHQRKPLRNREGLHMTEPVIVKF